MRHTLPTKFHVPSTVTNDYIRQLNAEIKTSRIAPLTGRLVHFWKQVRKDNHLRDCELMNIAMALAGGILEDEAMKEADSQKAFGFMKEAPVDVPPPEETSTCVPRTATNRCNHSPQA